MTTRTFTINRETDVTGISGTGHVADGVQFPDGTVVVRWRDLGGPAAERGVRPTTVVFESIDAVQALHGHNGATTIIWGSLTSICKHCGRTIVTTRPRAGWVHADGTQHGLGRCHGNSASARATARSSAFADLSAAAVWRCEYQTAAPATRSARIEMTSDAVAMAKNVTPHLDGRARWPPRSPTHAFRRRKREPTSFEPVRNGPARSRAHA